MITLYFSELINATTISHFIRTFQESIVSSDFDGEVRIMISSGGGEVDVAIELYHFLQDSGLKITTVNTSVVNSAAVILYLAGTQRICYPESSFYIHSISKKFNGIYNADDLKREVKEIEVNTDIVSSILEKTTLKPKRFWKRMMRKGIIINAKEAYKYGLANKSKDNV